jgi:hypothetical protein
MDSLNLLEIFEECRHIEILAIYVSDLKVDKNLSSMGDHLLSLKELFFRCSSSNPLEVRYLKQSIQSVIRNARSLKLLYVPVSEEISEELIEVITNIPNAIESLQIGPCRRISSQSLQKLARDCPSLTSLESSSESILRQFAEYRYKPS